MTRILFVFIFLFRIILPVNSQEPGGTMNYTDNNGLKQGYWEQRYPNGNIQYRGIFSDNRPAGEFTRYFPGGEKMAVMDFCEEGRRAETKIYYAEGNLAATGVYLDEKKDSLWKYYSFYDNHLAGTETYNYGVREGPATVYYPDGIVSESFWYENDSRNGPWKRYYKNGSPMVEAEFRDDLRHGDFLFYSPDGTVEMKGEYKRNQMDGDWIFYDRYGTEITVIRYIEGIPENEDELIEKEQELFRQIELMRDRIPEPDESELFFPQSQYLHLVLRREEMKR